MSAWYAVLCKPRREALAEANLANQGYRVYLPRLATQRRREGKWVDSVEPLFPRYLFIDMDIEATTWRPINGTRGVIGLVTSGNRPSTAPAGVVEKLMADADADGVIPLTTLGFLAPGASVTVKSGAFKGQTGILQSILLHGQDRVKVLLNLLGARASLQLPSYAVEVV